MCYDKNEQKNICNIEIPYSSKLFLQELECMSYAPRLITNTNINNKPVFDHLLNNINDKNILYEEDDNEEEEVDED